VCPTTTTMRTSNGIRSQDKTCMRYYLRHRQTDKREDGRKKGTHHSGFILHERRLWRCKDKRKYKATLIIYVNKCESFE
jgi:hypothetical protein